MKAIIICDHYFDDSDANAICARNLVREFKTFGDNVHIITDDYLSNRDNNLWGDGSFVFVKESFFSRIQRKLKSFRFILFLLNFFRRFVNLFFYPNVSFARSVAVNKALLKMLSEDCFDLILAVYRPFESIKAIEMIGNRGCGIRKVAYHLDNLDDNSFSQRAISGFLKKRAKSAFQKEIKCFDEIFVAHSSNLQGPNVRRIGFPLYFKRKNIPFDYFFDERFINIVYVGSMDSTNRNPEFVIKVLSKLNACSQKPIILHIWGKNDGITEALDSSNLTIRYNGVIGNEYVEYIYESSDFILNIGNQITPNMIPSKLFHVFSSKKPVISFNKEGDASVSFLNAYGRSVVINYGIEPNYPILLSKMNSFCRFSHADGLLDKKDPFLTFSPHYIAREIRNNEEKKSS